MHVRNDAVHFVTRLGCGTMFIKVDIKSAYRIVLVHPADRHLLGIHLNGGVYVDQAVPSSLRTASKFLPQWLTLLAGHF